jgi:hypothetical protein
MNFGFKIYTKELRGKVTNFLNISLEKERRTARQTFFKDQVAIHCKAYIYKSIMLWKS